MKDKLKMSERALPAVQGQPPCSPPEAPCPVLPAHLARASPSWYFRVQRKALGIIFEWKKSVLGDAEVLNLKDGGIIAKGKKR